MEAVDITGLSEEQVEDVEAGKIQMERQTDISENSVVTLPVSGLKTGSYILKVKNKSKSCCNLFLKK